MPPKPKFTKEDTLQVAFQIVRAQGGDALTARSLGAAMGCSTRPLFTHFASMDQLKKAVAEGPAARAFEEYYRGFGEYTPAFKRFGMMLVSFAENEPHLFRFLFMSAHGEAPTLDQWCNGVLGSEAMEALKRDYGLNDQDAYVLFREVWLHAFALCVLKVSGAVVITDQEASDSLSRSFMGLLVLAKTGQLAGRGIQPVQGGQLPCGLDDDLIRPVFHRVKED